MTCERLNGCLFYNDKMPMDAGVGAMYKLKYCEGDKGSCARYLVINALGIEFVPDTLFPNMIEAAKEIIAQSDSQ